LATERRFSKMFTKISALALGIALLPGATHSQQLTLEAVPPVVVETVPKAGSGDVDPALAEIRVTYSKDMQDGSWSWSTLGEENFPETTGKPRYLEDKRTAVLPVKLVPGKTYAIWLNSQKFRNFKDADGQPAVPYLLVFKTGG
jgi:RNA polymerase sigma-70 factor (ECF subfamily)